MGERYDYGKWIESKPIGHNKRIARYNAKHNRITFEHYSQTLEEFEETAAKLYPADSEHRIELENFILLCKQSTIAFFRAMEVAGLNEFPNGGKR